MVRLWEKLKRGKFYRSFRSLRIRVFCLIILTGIIPCIVLHFGILERYLNNAVAVRTSEDTGKDYSRSPDHIQLPA